MPRPSPSAAAALGFGLISTAAGALGLPRWVWLTALVIGCFLAVWSVREYYARHRPQVVPAPARSEFEDWALFMAGYVKRGHPVHPCVAPEIDYRLDSDSSIPLYFTWWGDWELLCTVTGPDGRNLPHRFVGGRFHEAQWFNGNYPRGFMDAYDLMPGEYEFRWSRLRFGGHEGQVLWKDYLTISAELLESRAEGVELPVRRVIVYRALRSSISPREEDRG